MSSSPSDTSTRTPFLASNAAEIERHLCAAKKPLDTVCGYFATDPALLLHWLRELDNEQRDVLPDQGLRGLAQAWLEASDHRWYASLTTVAKSRLDATQQGQHRTLCARAALAAGLIGEWASVNALPCGSSRIPSHRGGVSECVAVVPSG